VTPTVGGPAGRHAACVIGPRADGGEQQPARDRDRIEVVDVRDRLHAPAVGSPTGRYAARMFEAHAHGGEGEPARDRDRREAAGRRAGAELAEEVVTPA